MAFDGITIAAIVKELDDKLSGGRLTKISQPEKEEIIFTIKNAGEQHRLFFSVSASLPLVYLTSVNKQGPLSAPNFCMVLRKYLQGAKIKSVSQPGLERVIEIDMEHLDEMGDICIRKLKFELMGKYSNLILCDQNSKILDSLKHVSSMMSSVREVLPGREYFIPQTIEKTNALKTDYNEFAALLIKEAQPAYKRIYSAYTGISPFIAIELCNSAGIDDRFMSNNLSGEQIKCLYSSFESLMKIITEQNFTPVILSENNKWTEYAVTPLCSYPKESITEFDSVSEMLQTFYEHRNVTDVMRQKTAALRKQLQTTLERDYKKLDLQIKQLNDAKKREKYRIYGELLNTYGYELQDGAKSACVLNYYTNEQITIPLNEQKNIKENAKQYFDKYVKMKRAQEALTKQVEETQKEIDYLEGIQTFLQFAKTEADLNQIRQELYEKHYIRKRPEKSKVQEKNPFLHYRTEEGYDIYVGRNNLQNEELTHKFATGNDWWFHAKGVPGSHVIVKASFENPAKEWDMPDKVFEAAACLAAIFSKNKEQDKVEVDYLRKKNVKHPAGSEPGFVVYYTNFSMVIDTNIERFALTLLN